MRDNRLRAHSIKSPWSQKYSRSALAHTSCRIVHVVDMLVSIRLHMPVVSDSHYQSTLDVVCVNAVPWSEFAIVPSYPLSTLAHTSCLRAVT